MTGTDYHLDVVNNSTNFVDLCVYQTPPDLGLADVMALAWFSEPAHQTTTVKFTWSVDYSFVWSDEGDLVPGVVFDASQVWPADPDDPAAQQVLFTYEKGAYTFREGQAAAGAKPGSLYIRELAAVPLRQASVGVGMSGAGTFAVAAQPNQNLVFTPHPEYWLTAGTFQAGQVLDIEEITDNVAIAFPPGVTTMTAVLGADNAWTVTPG